MEENIDRDQEVSNHAFKILLRDQQTRGRKKIAIKKLQIRRQIIIEQLIN